MPHPKLMCILFIRAVATAPEKTLDGQIFFLNFSELRDHHQLIPRPILPLVKKKKKKKKLPPLYVHTRSDIRAVATAPEKTLDGQIFIFLIFLSFETIINRFLVQFYPWFK